MYNIYENKENLSIISSIIIFGFDRPHKYIVGHSFQCALGSILNNVKKMRIKGQQLTEGLGHIS